MSTESRAVASSRRPCAACGGTRVVALQGWQQRLALGVDDVLWLCRRCGLAWLEQAVSDVGPVYEEGYFDDYAHRGGMPGGVDSVPPHVDARLTDLTGDLGRPGTFLDVGCGFGNVLHAARERGWSVQGLDVSDWSAEHVRQTWGIDVTVGDILTVDVPANAFDVVHASHALEHMADPSAALVSMRRWLRPGGVLVIEVPNQLHDLYESFRWAVMRRYVAPPVRNSHLYFFTTRSLELLLRRAGYTVSMIRTERRNANVDSRIPLGRAVKQLLFTVERRLRRGPNIVIWARPREGGAASA